MKHPFSYVFAAVAGWFVAAPSTIDVEQAKSDAAALVAYATLAKASPLPTPPAPPAPVRAEPKAGRRSRDPAAGFSDRRGSRTK
jgi:hypothetical protein